MDNLNSESIQTILLVDDNPDHVELFSNSIEKVFPFSQIITAMDGEVALNILGMVKSCSNQKMITPDVILLDINLPKYSGFDILRSIKKEKRLKNISVIIISTSANQDDIDLMMELGADNYICKSDFNDDLGRKLNNLRNIKNTKITNNDVQFEI